MTLGASKRGLRIIVLVAGIALIGLLVALFNKPAIVDALSTGDTVRAEFSRDYKLEVDNSDVKMAGTPIGKVSDVSKTDRGTFMVTMKVDGGILDKLGSEPSAEIRPTTVLGGKYYVSLKSGGATGTFTADAIPVNRCKTPVELDTLLSALPPPVRTDLQGVVGHLDDALGTSKEPLRDTLRTAPGTLRPATSVLDAARGTRPEQDLYGLVTDLDATAQVLSRRNGQLADVMDKLKGTTGVLGDQATPFAETLHALPASLKSLRSGATDLRGTLDKLQTTAHQAKPAIAELDPLLRKLDPVLRQTRPLLADLRPTLQQTRPMVQQLVPTVQEGTHVLTDLKGPVMQRVRGPIAHSLMSEWHGKAPKYPHGGGNGHKFYQEIGYMFTVMDQMTEHQDLTGTFLSFQFGVAPNSIVNAPGGLDTLLEGLSKLMGPPQDQETAIDTTGLVPGASPPNGPLSPQQQGLLSGVLRGLPGGKPAETGGARGE